MVGFHCLLFQDKRLVWLCVLFSGGTRKQSMATPLAPTYESPWDRLTAAALAYADASDDEDEFAKARDRLRKAAVAYARTAPMAPAPPTPSAPRVRNVRTPGQLELWTGEAERQ